MFTKHYIKYLEVGARTRNKEQQTLQKDNPILGQYQKK